MSTAQPQPVNTALSPVRRALLSVSDKTGIVEFAAALASLNIELLSTGGTFRSLQEAGITVTEIADYTGFPEIMEGRVKTLHPKVHGGILGRRGTDDAVMQAHDIPTIDMVVVNLYPFQKTVAKLNCTLGQAIENIDIGGPTMLRAAAKNFNWVAVVSNPEDYSDIITELQQHNGKLSGSTRYRLALRTFEHTANYDGAIANWLGARNENGETKNFSETFNMQLELKQSLRYGENPHQKAAFYVESEQREACISNAVQLQGIDLSFNNIADTDSALECVKTFSDTACVIVKHANPCGVAVAKSPLEAYLKAYETDPVSAFGGIIAFNRELDESTAAAIIERQFAEVIIAPGVSSGAKACLATKPKLRLMSCAPITEKIYSQHLQRVTGGLLVQDHDLGNVTQSNLKLVTKRSPSEAEMQDLLFAWKVVKAVKSNAIVYCRDGKTIGIGAGQMSRVYSARIAAIKAADAGLTVSGAVMASDAFFPFRDGIDAAKEVGITAIIHPGGSMRDEEIIAAADEAGIAMIFTGMRHFRH